MLKLAAPTKRSPIDLPAAALLAGAAGALLLVCSWGGQRYAWASPTIAGLGALAVLCTGLLVWRQFRSREPFIPPRLLRLRALRVVTLLQLVAGIGLASAIVYITLELQLVRGVSPLQTGLRLLP